ncbi:MAG: phospho-N-acetylmuramoyl-pentapeptide-transferase [Chloroflexi bacterium]|nr:phospho-N-acetylmuramoyl-pentapeptide-transferase [Chloroflexota bacterium]
MAYALALAIVSFGLGVAFGPIWLRFLKAHRMGKQLNPSEPAEHAHKEGTPTMGGVVFLAPIFVVTLLALVLATGRLIMLVPLAVAAACAGIGAVDDLQTLVGQKRSAGLSPAVKWGAQLLIGLGAGIGLAWAGITQVHVPFVGAYDLRPWLYVPFAAVVLVSTINAVAITDGLDSLAATTGALAFGAFLVIGVVLGYPLTAALCGTIVGALLAYLWFNAHPAQMWMGDVGSLALGGLLGTVALIEREPLLLLPVGIIFVTNVVSDILQVLSVKLRGKRLFKIAPLHHHYTRAGWPETWIVQRFWIVGAIGAFAGILAAVTG